MKFVNVSISSLGVFGQSTNSLICFKRKIIAMCIHASYYIFCLRNKDWTSLQGVPKKPKNY